MNLNKKILAIILAITCIMILTAPITAYTGTGFSHNIPDNYYSSYSEQDILNKYNDTYLTSEEKSVCTKVVDGDTIYLANGKKVRFVGVNTPEKGVTGYKASKNFVEKFCLNKEVGINIDDKKYTDKYGRTLAVVIVKGKNLNEMLLKEGLAEVMYIPPSEFSPYKWAGENTHTSTYTSTAKNSTTQSVSTHNPNAGSTTSSDTASYVGNKKSGKFHKSSCREVSKMSQKNKIFFNNRNEAVNQGYVGCKICNP